MENYHIVGLGEGQLHSWQGSAEALARALGEALLASCLGPGRDFLGDPVTDQHESTPNELQVHHLDVSELDGTSGDFKLWMWQVDDLVCMADLPADDVELAVKFAHAVLHDQGRRAGTPASG